MSEISISPDLREALHETGHACVCVLGKIPFQHVELRELETALRDLGPLGRVCGVQTADFLKSTPDAPWKLTCMAVAGATAEHVFYGDHVQDVFIQTARKDLADAQSFAQLLCTPENPTTTEAVINSAIQAVKGFLHAERERIIVVANALASRRFLKATDIAGILFSLQDSA